MPDQSSPCIPVPERIAGLMAEDLRRTDLDIPGLIGRLGAAGWQQHQIEAYLGRAVLLAWQTAHPAPRDLATRAAQSRLTRRTGWPPRDREGPQLVAAETADDFADFRPGGSA